MAANADAAELFVVRVVPLLCNSNDVVAVDVVVVGVVIEAAAACRRRNTSRVRCKPFGTAFVEFDVAAFGVEFDVTGLSTVTK